ncbi:MAG: DUF134 domain-containing protein [Lachnospiraceae bacterium]|nr:DUF134 domain-containing protein [Lachnospiraceae bacterium]
MARPKKYRKICHFPKTLTFLPVGNRSNKEPVILTIDEYETLRLIDREGRSQEECSTSMKVARTTVQMIYASARKKVADAIVEGRSLEIEGGDYDLCNGEKSYCSRQDCHKKMLYEQYQKPEGITRIALAVREGVMAEEVEKASQIKLIDMKANQISHSHLLDFGYENQESLADYLHILHVDELICNGIKEHDRNGLEEIGIHLRNNENNKEEIIRTYLER